MLTDQPFGQPTEANIALVRTPDERKAHPKEKKLNLGSNSMALVVCGRKERLRRKRAGWKPTEAVGPTDHSPLQQTRRIVAVT